MLGNVGGGQGKSQRSCGEDEWRENGIRQRDRVLPDQNSVCLGVWAVSAKGRRIIFAV